MDGDGRAKQSNWRFNRYLRARIDRFCDDTARDPKAVFEAGAWTLMEMPDHQRIEIMRRYGAWMREQERAAKLGVNVAAALDAAIPPKPESLPAGQRPGVRKPA